MANKKRKCGYKLCEVGRFVVETTTGAIITPVAAFCSIDCASGQGRLLAAKAKENKLAKTIREEKVYWQRKREDIKPLGTICSQAQHHVNAMILAADRALGHPCIATGRKAEHAGHYVHAGSKYRISWLRFFHGNIHGQNAESNTHKSGDTVNYRAGVVERYGNEYIDDVEEFKRLTDCREIPPPTREEVAAMVKWCKGMTKIYKLNTVR